MMEHANPRTVAPMPHKAVIVISSQVARGTVGVRAASFALEACGHAVWSVPTVLLPWHPGRNAEAGPGTRIVPDDTDFASLLNDLASAPWIGEVGAVLTGYFATPAQVEAAAALVAKVKTRTDAIHVCDPVIGDLTVGDGGGLYVPTDVAETIRDHLLPLADIATPNRYELRWLTGSQPFETNDQAADAARTLAPARTLVTTALPLMRNATGNLLVDSERALLAEHRALPQVPNGTGDLTAALLTHHMLNGAKPQVALERTTASCFEVVARTVGAGGDELMIESNVEALRRPGGGVTMRQLV